MTEPDQASLSPRNSVIGEFTKEAGLAALRGSTNSLSKGFQELDTKDKLVIDKRTYQDLISYIARADSKRQDPDKTSQMINIYSDAAQPKLKPSSGQQKIKLSNSVQSRNSEIQTLQTTQRQQLKQMLQFQSPSKSSLLKNPG